MPKAKILVIEDEKDIVELLRYNLEREGYQVFSASIAEEGLRILQKEPPDLLVLDLMLPGNMDGSEVCRLMRQDPKTKNIPILMLTAKSEESDVVVGLGLGADDYVTKPFSPKILVARIKAVLRRASQKQESKEIRVLGNLTMDLPKRKIVCRKIPIGLTTLEFDILEFLTRHPGRVFSRDQIMDQVWKEGKFIVDRAVDVHIRALRKKLGAASDFIETIRGVGYRFKDMEESDE